MQTSLAANLRAAVFSFNRGPYLLNCISSIERHLPGVKITIYDDGSDCRRTQSMLQELAARHTVVIRGDRSKGYLGGLYANIRQAVDDARSDGATHVFLVQDDQQFVRRCDNRFFSSCEAIFDSDPSIAQIACMFTKGYLPREQVARDYVPVENPGYYAIKRGISDTGLVSIEALDRAGFSFLDSEGASSADAMARSLRLVLHRDPVLMFTPWPATIRGYNLKGLVLSRLNEWGVGSGLHPFDDMSDDAVNRLLSRDIIEYPIAENHLRCKHPGLKMPWYYSSVFDPKNLFDLRRFIMLRWVFGYPDDYSRFVGSGESAFPSLDRKPERANADGE